MVRHLGARATNRKVRLFVVASCRLVQAWFGERRSLHEIETGERMADGLPEDAEKSAELDAEDARVAQAVREGMNPSWAHDGDIPLVRGVAKNCVGHAREAAERVIAAFEWCDFVRYPFSDVLGGGELVVEDSMPARQCRLLRDLFGNPFRPVPLSPSWLAWNDGAIRKMAQTIYNDRAFDRLPILADALEDAGCDDVAILNHCREPGEHVRGCWLVDLVLGRE